MPKVSVVVCTYNRRDDLRHCLDHLMKQTYKDFEILVVDGGSTDGTIQLIQNYSVKLIRQHEKGIVHAYNLGWKNARGEIVAYIDDDAIADENWLLNVVSTFEKSNKIGGVTGPVIIPEACRSHRDLIAFLEKRRNFLGSSIAIGIYKAVILEGKHHEINRILESGAFSLGSSMAYSASLQKEVPVDYLSGSNMSFRRELLELTGGFDKYYSGVRAECSEPDLHFKIRKLGNTLLFNAKAVVWHFPGPISSRAHSHAQSSARNFVYFYLKHFRPLTINKILKFSLNLLYQNAYWFYNFSLTGNLEYLRGIRGIFDGFIHFWQRS